MSCRFCPITDCLWWRTAQHRGRLRSQASDVDPAVAGGRDRACLRARRRRPAQGPASAAGLSMLPISGCAAALPSCCVAASGGFLSALRGSRHDVSGTDQGCSGPKAAGFSGCQVAVDRFCRVRSAGCFRTQCDAADFSRNRFGELITVFDFTWIFVGGRDVFHEILDFPGQVVGCLVT